MGWVDLHLHTHYSDGADTPEQVVRLAQQAGVVALSISDHDTVEGLPDSRRAADAAGIEFINGIELSADHEGIEVHILGYLFDEENDALSTFLSTQKQNRLSRLKQSVKQLADEGLPLDADAIVEFAGPGTVGRPHVARAMVEKGYVATFREAFDVYLGVDKPGYVAFEKASPERVIRLLRAAGGVPVVAHPIFLGDDQLIEAFRTMGLMGVEAYHSAHRNSQREHYRRLAERLGLVCTGGSDYHGSFVKEGSEVGSEELPYSIVDALKQARAELE